MIVAFALLIAGLLLSAIFSGTETGFYRIPRLRLVLDALGGDTLARCLLWLINHPALFVATTLIGNNLANYMTSLAIVLLVHELFLSGGAPAEIAAILVFSPILFVLGELLPKNLFYHAPNRLLRAVGPLVLMFTVLFSLVSVILWAISKFLEWIVGASPQSVQLTLARKELNQVLEEGHEIGLLRPTQRMLAQGVFSVAKTPAAHFAQPWVRMARVPEGTSRDDVFRIAKRHHTPLILVEKSTGKRQLLGYVRLAEVLLAEVLPDSGTLAELVRPLLEIPSTDDHLSALMKMQAANEPIAQLVDDRGASAGVLTFEQLSQPLFRGGR